MSVNYYARQPILEKSCIDCGNSIFIKKSNFAKTSLCRPCTIKRSVRSASKRRKNIFTCQQCAKVFYTQHARPGRPPVKFCSYDCHRTSMRRFDKPTSVARDWRTCQVCGIEFPGIGTEKCCSKICKRTLINAANKHAYAKKSAIEMSARKPIKCRVCGKNSPNKRGRIFCGPLCAAKYSRRLDRENLPDRQVREMICKHNGSLRRISAAKMTELIVAYRLQVLVRRELNKGA